ncbi:hypothetical protein CRH09_08015 [Nocardia terpenica]|uniref:Uncharacterized protein n=1 Tax=Nocardia terpenica TaxID=455432 RepID=A0A291RGB8_9NOCA|nr:hypothetical protein CRH09_08015 [Nocardia terpenica]
MGPMALIRVRPSGADVVTNCDIVVGCDCSGYWSLRSVVVVMRIVVFAEGGEGGVEEGLEVGG